MKVCRECLYTEHHPLGLMIDQDGICTGCRVHREKRDLDWSPRLDKLKRLTDSYRASTHKQWDCIVPISGARDSFFIVHTIKHVLGLNPLLVTYNRNYNTQAGIHNITQLRTQLGCDIITQTLSPKSIHRIMQGTLEQRGSIHWHAIAGQTVFPVQTAIRYKIPLIIWGHHQGLDQVGMFSHTDEVEMTRRYRREHDLMGMSAGDLVGKGDKLTEAELLAFSYPRDKALHDLGVRGIYLGNYIPWDSLAQHKALREKYDYYTGRLERTFDPCNDVDCQIFTGLHDHIKFRKHGYTKVVDDVCREIRFGRITRTEGQNLVENYAKQTFSPPEQVLAPLDLSSQSFYELIDRHRDPAIWARKKDGHWTNKTVATRTDHLSPTSSIPKALQNYIQPYNQAVLGSPKSPQLLTRGQGERL